MTWSEWDTWIVVVGALCAAACALPGCFLLLRGMSLMGDAISHAVLPGIAIAYLVTESRASLPMFLGAAVVGVLTAVFTQWVSKFGNVDRGAAMGIVFTTLFAAGLIIIRQAADRVELDASCVLYGAIESAPMDTVFDSSIPRAAIVVGGSLLLNVFFTLVFYKELRISSFDAELADALGFSSGLMHYLLMTIVAVTTVAAFEVVGSIIVIAMMIVPPATAFLLTRRLSVFLILSALIGMLSALIGHWSAGAVPSWFGYKQTSTSGMMAATTGGLFLLAWFFSPQGGVLTKRLRRLTTP